MRTVLSHYQTLLDDYRTPSGSFRDMMCSAPHRGFLEDHRSVRFAGSRGVLYFLTVSVSDRYPYLDLAPEDIERYDATDVSVGPFIMRCENDGKAFRIRVDALFGELSRK
jgi:hypothetical protein